MGVTSKDGSDGSEGSEGKEGGSDRIAQIDIDPHHGIPDVEDSGPAAIPQLGKPEMNPLSVFTV